jgi:hypothetical protein
MSWQKYATAEELLALGVPPDRVDAVLESGPTVMVYACEDHLLAPDLMAMTHQAECPAPPDCSCPVLSTLPATEDNPVVTVDPPTERAP